MYHPILNKFRDAQTEDVFKRMEKAQVSTAVADGERRAAEHNQTFNIINNKMRKKGKRTNRKTKSGIDMQGRTRVPDSHTPWK